MMSPAEPPEILEHARPTGLVQPDHERAVRALRALAEGRLNDATSNIDAIPESPPILQTWKQLLGGMLAIARGELSNARELLSEAAGLRGDDIRNATSELTQSDDHTARLTGRALEQLGLVYRRWEQPEDAYHLHLQAFLLRNEHGSYEEVWESASSLAIDADIAGHHEDALAWHGRAIDAAAKASEESESKQAMAWTNLATSLSQISRHDEAVEAARTARDCWHRHDLGAATAAKADARLGSVLLKKAEALHEAAPDQARVALEEATGLLSHAADALEAFGPKNAPDIRWCREQIDFAERLGRSIQE